MKSFVAAILRCQFAWLSYQMLLFICWVYITVNKVVCVFVCVSMHLTELEVEHANWQFT